MKLTLTSYGKPQLIVIPLVLLGLAGLLGQVCPGAFPWPLMVAVVLILAVLAFFRDPHRNIPSEKNILIAPADGKVTDIAYLDENEYLKQPAIRIGIFLSVFDVHINRTPCGGTVQYIKHHPGKCLNALRSQAASEQNESNCLGLTCPEHPARKVMVKQITGAIARRIVCRCRVGDYLAAGERFGMIKFGSRTELFLPKNEQAKILVKKGDTVRAGKTLMVRYQLDENSNTP
ncbi:MAG: phosphatidylserine decarboxylase family protein [Sedimentisphaerales bacterium]|nr:phosphatidylserine decarboxylase family protein [Sedimentisphaerales bacterium]